ncbi:SCO3242 family prenyltransferase [Micromonospora matsumotoense]|uniref:SCO3242 family prenyltransferase n=1 Tax=Micromonospora matsumotoense TaxID=121616 RepID=UPI003D8D4FC4
MTSVADLAELVRAPAALSVPGDLVAGAAAAGVLGPRTAGLAGASVLLYWAGMAANDWADRRLDAEERPERPIPSGRISPTAAAGVAVGLTAAGLGLAAAVGGRRATAIALPLAATIWGYDLAAKNTAAGPAVMAACRGLDVLLGASSGRPVRALPAALTVAAHTWTVTALSRREVSGADVALPRRTLAGTALVALAATTLPRPTHRPTPGTHRPTPGTTRCRRRPARPVTPVAAPHRASAPVPPVSAGRSPPRCRSDWRAGTSPGTAARRSRWPPTPPPVGSGRPSGPASPGCPRCRARSPHGPAPACSVRWSRSPRRWAAGWPGSSPRHDHPARRPAGRCGRCRHVAPPPGPGPPG